jgi:serine/threonine-protein kinase
MIESLGSFEAKYEILERIGEGGMGAVYRVRHRLLDDIRVIKTMRATVANRMGARDRFFREARIAAKLRHDNIAHVFDFAMDEDTAFLVLEYIDGVTLQEILATSGPPSLRLGLEIAQQSLRALAFIHEMGIIHRDISPDNLMLTIDQSGNPKIKLIDLGLAKITEDSTMLTQDGQFLGKIRYASPEQFQSNQVAAVGTWSDVYSFGLVFYELLTGSYPIRGRDGPGLLAGHLTQAPLSFAESDPDGHIPPELRSIVLSSLEKIPTNRFADAQSYHDAVQRVQRRFPLEDAQRAEAVRLKQRVQAEPRSQGLDVSSDQSRIDGVFRADKSSAGDSHSADPTISHYGGREAQDPTVIHPTRFDQDGRTATKATPDHGQKMPAKKVAPSPPHPRPAPAAATRTRWIWLGSLVAAAALAVLSLTGLIDLGIDRGGVSQPEPHERTLGTATLILDARPWAEVVRISNSNGEDVPVVGSRYTPLAVSLDPGQYNVILKNDSYGQRELTVTVPVGETIMETIAFAAITEDEFLRRLGVPN